MEVQHPMHHLVCVMGVNMDIGHQASGTIWSNLHGHIADKRPTILTTLPVRLAIHIKAATTRIMSPTSPWRRPVSNAFISTTG